MRASFAGVCVLCGLVGCFEPQIRDGQIACELDETCPSGFLCIEGTCRNTAPGGKGDDPDADGPDGGTGDPGDDGSIPAGPGPKIYSHRGGAWTAISASGYFAGSAINSAAIQTSWAYCQNADNIRCWADAAVVACDFGAGPIDTDWDELGGSGLRNLSPLFSSVYYVDNAYDHLFHRGKEWRGFFGPVMELSNGAIITDLDQYANSGGGDPDLEDFFGNAPGAPSSFDEIIWDYLDVAGSGDPWHMVRADGRRFTVRNNGEASDGGTVPELAEIGAPLAGNIRAGFDCSGELVVYAVD